MNGFYDTAVIMPTFQNDPYDEFHSDDSDEEFISDDEFDTPILTGVSQEHNHLQPMHAAHIYEDHHHQEQEVAYLTQDDPVGRWLLRRNGKC